MTPRLTGIDHVHVYVHSWTRSAAWYRDVLGFEPVEKLRAWAVPGGPLTLEDPSGSVHLALFEDDRPPTSTIAFGTTGEQFLAWKTHMESRGIGLRVTDHNLAWSMYFTDPDGNYHEITTYDTDVVNAALASNPGP